MIDLVIPCYRRDQDLRFWLSFGPKLFDSFCLSSIILGCGPFVLVLALNGLTGKSSWRRYTSPKKSSLSDIPFNSLKSKSVLLLQSFAFTQADYLFFLDCDLRLPKCSLQSLYDCVRVPNGTKRAAYINEVHETGLASRRIQWTGELPVLTTDSDGSRHIKIQSWTSVNARPGFGNLICRREDYVSCGGHDVRYNFYGWEDHDLLISLQLDGCLVIPTAYAFHLSHGDSRRQLCGMSRSQCVNMSKKTFLDKYSSLVL